MVASATINTTSGTIYKVTDPNGWGATGWYSSGGAACSAYAALLTGQPAFGAVVEVSSGADPANYCYIKSTSRSSGAVSNSSVVYGKQGGSVCPANSNVTGGTTSGSTTPGTCTCSSGFNESGSSCVPVPNQCADLKGQPLRSGGQNSVVPYSPSTGLGSTFIGCTGSGSGDPAAPGCALSGAGQIAYQRPDGSWVAEVSYSYTGGKCTADPNGATTGTPGASSPTPTPSSCPPGKASGTVNGSTVCYTPQTSTQPTSTQTSSNPGGVGGTGTAPSGATQSETSTTCTGSRCTTTTTWKDGTGATVGTSTKTESRSDFCEDNPKSLMCIQSSWGAGDCSAPPACDGDPVFCAIATSDWKTKCALNPDPGPESALYDSEKSKSGSVLNDLPGSGNSSIGPGSFDQAERFSASGLSDLTITVAGRPVTLQISVLNPWLVWMGNLLVAVSFLAAMAIVFKGQN